MNPIDRLSSYFKEFPGIGERQARRFVYFLMQKHPEYVADLSSMIGAIRQNVSQCTTCFHFFPGSGRDTCDVCVSPNTDIGSLLVIEKDADYENIKKSGGYSGRYFVLGGLVPIVERDTKRKIRAEELVRAIERQAGLKEIVLALSLSPHGEHTDTYLRELLLPVATKLGITITSLGRGLSTGTELEYSDTDTLKNALRNRK